MTVNVSDCCSIYIKPKLYYIGSLFTVIYSIAIGITCAGKALKLHHAESDVCDPLIKCMINLQLPSSNTVFDVLAAFIMSHNI